MALILIIDSFPSFAFFQELLFLLMLYFFIFSEEAFFWATFLKTYALLFAVFAWSALSGLSFAAYGMTIYWLCMY